jgi:hypothetical protein
MVESLVQCNVILRLQIFWYTWQVRRSRNSLEKKMALVMHAFQESKLEEQMKHLDLWFGYPTGPIPDNPNGEVCRCGAVATPLAKDRSVLAVYHVKSMRRSGNC